MTNPSEIFEHHYQDYLKQLAEVDFTSVNTILGLDQDGDRLTIPFFNSTYSLSPRGIYDHDNNRPDYMTCVILSKYVLLCPSPQPEPDPDWSSFRDLKKTSHFTNVQYFNSDTERVIDRHFSGQLAALTKASRALKGCFQTDMPYDLSVRFDALPRLALLLLFNDVDDEFPARCKVLFQRQAEQYLDPESIAMTGSLLARQLKTADGQGPG